jgi:two-component system, OmpR family, copper resistance phosphate regulon response regulator CusR
MEPESPLTIGGLEVDPIRRIVIREGHRIDLTAREFDLVEYLVRNHGRVVSREMLARDVWKETSRATPLDNVIDVHIARLRKKLDDPFGTKLLHTVRGVGFTLAFSSRDAHQAPSTQWRSVLLKSPRIICMSD